MGPTSHGEKEEYAFEEREGVNFSLLMSRMHTHLWEVVRIY
jgi:hypothetical protein